MSIQLIFQIIIFLSAFAFLDPFMILMPTPMQYLALGLLVIATSLYGLVLFKEQILDERDEKIRAFTHRVSYLIAVIGLVAIITFHLIKSGHVYPEMIVLLLIILIAKGLAHWYANRNF